MAFVEMTRKNYEKMKKMLEEMGVKVEITDCTLPKDKEAMVHVDIVGLTEKQKAQINEVFAQEGILVQKDIPVERNETNMTIQEKEQFNSVFGKGSVKDDRDGDGIDDNIEKEMEEDQGPREIRRRKSDQKFVGQIKGAIDDFTGKNREEEIIYEGR